MAQSQPPFSALRALEAATRHRSFTRAAEELRVTHSAVSQAVRRLEAEMGARLFDRRGGAMEPSDAAQKLADSYSAAAEQLTALIREIRGDDSGSGRVALRMPAEVARLWMPGREGRLSEAMPDIDVVVSDDDTQAEVELLATPKPRPTDQVLAAVVNVPMGAPTLLEARWPQSPADVLRLPLLADRRDGWINWAARHLPGARPRPRVIRDRSELLDAAVAGAGIVLSDQLIAQSHLTSGALRQIPFPVEDGEQLALRRHAGPSQTATFDRLAMWLKLELARDAALVRKLVTDPSPLK